MQDVTFEAPVDWAAVSLGGESPLFYIAFEVATTMSTNPLVTEMWAADQLEHALHIPVVGAFAIADLDFFGFGASGGPKWHGENSIDAIQEDAYAFSNQDATEQVGNGTITGIGQSITGAAGGAGRVVGSFTAKADAIGSTGAVGAGRADMGLCGQIQTRMDYAVCSDEELQAIIAAAIQHFDAATDEEVQAVIAAAAKALNEPGNGARTMAAGR